MPVSDLTKYNQTREKLLIRADAVVFELRSAIIDSEGGHNSASGQVVAASFDRQLPGIRQALREAGDANNSQMAILIESIHKSQKQITERIQKP